ncbi:MAG: protealysin inhibitor emfourin [Chloroflexota bacterium]
MAKISFKRSGGFLEPPIDLTLDLDSLVPHEAQRFMYLIEDADFFRFPEELVTESAVDEFIYTITVKTGSARHCVHVSEMYLSEPLQLLVDELSEFIPAFEYS